MTNRASRWPAAGAAAVLALSAAALAAPPEAGAQGRFEDAEIRTVHVTGDVYMLAGPGGNVGALVGEERTLLIDDKYAPLSPKIRAALEEIGPGNVAYVLNTHCHGDHTGGNEVFGKTAPIIAHANVRRRLADSAAACGGDRASRPEVALPAVTFGDSVTVHFAGEELRVLHQPHAHTDGDAVVLFTRSNVVHMGDLFFNGRFPFVDLATGGDVEGMIRGVERVLERVPDDAAVIPGHGPLGDVPDLRRYLRMLKETRRVVRKRMSRGMGLQQVRAAGLPSEWKEWSWEFIGTDRWIETLYRSLSG